MQKTETTPDRSHEREHLERTVKVVSGADRAEPRRREEAVQTARIVYTQTRVVNVAPEVLQRHRIITGAETGAAITAYRLLRTQVLRAMQKNGWNVLGITSPGMGEGKTLTAINLAISLALDVNHTVMLVDLDLRRPAVHRYFGIEPGRGLADFLAEGRDLREMLFNPGIERLVVLPGGTPVQNSSEMLSSPRMGWLADEMRSRYSSRLVLFDMPPLLAADDVLAFSRHLDAVLLVVEEGRTGRDELQRARTLLQDIPVLGPVINKARAEIATY